MENFFKTLGLIPSYWLILARESLRESAKIITEFKGDATKWLASALLQILIFLVMAILIPNVNVVSSGAKLLSLFKIPPFITELIFVVCASFLFNFIVYVPAKLYYETRRKQDRNTWEHITVRKIGIPNKKAFRGYGIQVKNDKPFNLSQAIVQIPSFEIDGVRYEQEEWFGFSQRPDTHIRRLYWMNDENSIQETEKSIDEDGGSATAYLFDIVLKDKGIKKFYLRYYEKSETSGNFVDMSKQVKNRAHGLLVLHIRYEMGEQICGGTGNKYYFEVLIDNVDEITFTLSEKPISIYKPPRTK